MSGDEPLFNLTIPCRFGDGPAVALIKFNSGCFCYPNDREQWLCEHHIHRATPLDGMKMIKLAPGVSYLQN